VYRRRRNLVTRADGTRVNVARPRGQLFVCATGCCCGRTDDGFAPVPTELYHAQWERRRLRNVIHLTIGGCLGPCALANVVLLLFDGQALWFHSVNNEALVRELYDYLDAMLDADRVLPAPGALAACQFTASAWQARPDGQPVDDYRPRRRGSTASTPAGAHVCRDETSDASAVARLLAQLDDAIAVPRRNGELVFDEPWQGRAFAMAIALHEAGLFAWEEFRRELIARIAEAEAAGAFDYYEAWLAAFERVLAAKGVVGAEEIEESTYAFEYGERDDVF
jgi:nitrile hydratase accessory protein